MTDETNQIKLMELTSGYKCNNNCIFCSVDPKMRPINKTTDEVKKDILYAKKIGAEIIGFGGGEPTVRNDIIELVKFAKDQGFRTVRIQSNGRMFAYKDFTKRIIEAGANYFKFTMEGHHDKLHDSLTKAPGSFKEAVQGIKNIKELNRTVEVNTVITRQNYKFLPQIVKFFLNMEISQYVIVFPTIVGNAKINWDNISVKITDVVPYVQKSLDIIRKFGLDKGIIMNIPACLMGGYEDHVTYDHHFKSEVRGPGFAVNLDKKMKEDKHQIEECKKCRFSLICGGLRYDYADIFGFGDIKPVLGKKIEPKGATTKEILSSIS